MDVLPGINNHLGRPLFLPRVQPGVEMPLDANNVVTRDTTYELPAVGGQPPVRVTARAGTRVHFPPDATDKRLSVTRIPVDRTPMPLEDGRATNLFISVQPSGAIFEPALEVSFPNLDRLAPNSPVLLMSFDHDAGRYVKVGAGRVSADGRAVRSDPGSGVRMGAWHALPPEPPAKEATVLSHVEVERNEDFAGRSVEITEAVVRAVRAVPYSEERSAGGGLSKILLRAIIPMPPDEEPSEEVETVNVRATKPVITVAPQTINIGKGKTMEAEATLTTAPNGQPTFKWTSSDTDIATVQFAGGQNAQSSPSRVVITGGKKAGAAKIKVEFKDSNNGKAQPVEIEVNVIEVTFQEVRQCSGFDNTAVGNEPFWLTVALNGDSSRRRPAARTPSGRGSRRTTRRPRGPSSSRRSITRWQRTRRRRPPPRSKT